MISLCWSGAKVGHSLDEVTYLAQEQSKLMLRGRGSPSVSLEERLNALTRSTANPTDRLKARTMFASTSGRGSGRGSGRWQRPVVATAAIAALAVVVVVFAQSSRGACGLCGEEEEEEEEEGGGVP